MIRVLIRNLMAKHLFRVYNLYRVKKLTKNKQEGMFHED